MSRLVAATLLLAACGYDSQYTPPVDGRARPRWVENHVESTLSALPPGCADQMGWLTRPELRPPDLSVAPTVAVAVWVSRPLPLLPAPHLPPPLGWRPVGVRGTSRGSSFDALRAMGMVLAVIAAPATALTLATVRPELSDESAAAIDQVNAYNDLARSAGTMCATWGAP